MNPMPESQDSVYLEFKDVDSNPDATRRPMRSSLLCRLLRQELFPEGAFRKRPDDLPRVLALAREQEESCRRQNDLRGLSLCLANQALILKAQGHLAESLRLHDEATSVCAQLRDSRSVIRLLTSRAEVLAARNDFVEALSSLERAVALAVEKGETVLAEQARTALTTLRQKRGQPQDER